MMEASQRIFEGIVDLAPAAILFTLLVAIFGHRRSTAARQQHKKELLTNLCLHLFDLLVILPLVAIPAFVLTTALGIRNLAGIDWAQVPAWASFIAVVIVGDLIGYLRHRLEHGAQLWPVHATHHSDEAMDWLTLTRMHPLNRLTTTSIDMTVLLVIGFPPVALVFNNLVRHWWGFFIHSDLRWTLGPIGRVLISPAAHRVHHARPEELAGRNFATVFTVWHRVFGTWQDPAPLLDVPTGIAEGSQGFVGELARPFRMWFAGRTTNQPIGESAAI
jgi:sterol desaturase/sphingolipid hydroxylase (fatty acid hydroxylase superfamily)